MCFTYCQYALSMLNFLSLQIRILINIKFRYKRVIQQQIVFIYLLSLLCFFLLTVCKTFQPYYCDTCINLCQPSYVTWRSNTQFNIENRLLELYAPYIKLKIKIKSFLFAGYPLTNIPLFITWFTQIVFICLKKRCSRFKTTTMWDQTATCNQEPIFDIVHVVLSKIGTNFHITLRCIR